VEKVGGFNEPIPVRLGVLVERREDDGEDDGDVVSHEVDDILVVPIVQRTLCDLEVLRVDAPGELLEERDLDLLELDGLDDVEDLLHLVEKHDLLWAVDLRPVPEQAEEDLLRKRRVLLEELDDAIGELRVVEGERLGFVERDEDSGEEGLVLLLERKSEAVDDGTEDLEKLGDAVMALGLVDELEEDVVDGTSDEGSEVEEFAVDAVEGRFEEVALSRVFRVEQLKKLLKEKRAREASSVVCTSVLKSERT
jgi:hypothetical protein